MYKRIIKMGSVAMVAVGLIGATAMATTMTGAPNTSVDWAQEFSLTDNSGTAPSQPVSQIDLIMATPGVSFTSLSSAYTDIGQTTPVAGATSNLGATSSNIMFNPSDTAGVFFTAGFSPPSTSTPFSFYFETWNGSQFVTTGNAASVMASWSGSGWSFTPMTSSVPEPGSLALLAAGLMGLVGIAILKRRRVSGR